MKETDHVCLLFFWGFFCLHCPEPNTGMVEGGVAEMPAMQIENMVMEVQYSTVSRLTHNPGMQITLTRITINTINKILAGLPQHHFLKTSLTCMLMICKHADNYVLPISHISSISIFFANMLVHCLIQSYQIVPNPSASIQWCVCVYEHCICFMTVQFLRL